VVSIESIEDLKEIISLLLGKKLLRNESVSSFLKVGIRIE